MLSEFLEIESMGKSLASENERALEQKIVGERMRLGFCFWEGMYDASPELSRFVQSLPKTETHIHLEGSCPFEMIERAFPGKYPNGPPMWADDFRYESFYQFMDYYVEFCEGVFTSAEAYHACAKKVLSDCASQNCHYVETSFHVGSLYSGAITGPQLVDAVLSAAPEGLEVRVVMGMRHNDYEGIGKEIIDDCLSWERLWGIDLHGPEDYPLEPWTAEVWKRAGAAGKFLKAHAGEFMPASFVKRCIDELGTRRIQHGVRSIEDPELVEYLAREGIALDVCPISNLKLAVEGIETMSNHPIRQLVDAGVLCTINSDDTLMFGNCLSEEYYALHQDLGFSHLELARIALNGFLVADWDSSRKDDCISELKAIIDEREETQSYA